MSVRTKVQKGLLAVLLAGSAACSDIGPRQSLPPLDTIPGLIVSAPVPALAASTAALALGALLDGNSVYVSLAPGSVPTGRQATIRNPASGVTVTTAVLNGGFDPVALVATVGDTLVVTIIRTGSADPMVGVLEVKATRPLVVVRTDPPPKKVDVPLNVTIVIVFGTPIDATTVTTGSVQLWRGTTPVAGTVRFADAAHLRVEFHADTLLAGQTDYQLVLSQGIRDVNGVALDSAVTVPFTTGTAEPATALVFATVSAGNAYTCGVTTAGAAYCWGDNYSGALGNGTTASSTTPVPVAGGHTFTAVGAMYSKTCGVTTAGDLYCWGGGAAGWISGSTPELVAAGLDFVTVSVGAFHACGITSAGAAYCWGEGSLGVLGDGGIWWAHLVPTPVAVAGGLSFASVSAGVYSTCGVTTTGAAYCWGNNVLGGLGTGASSSQENCCSTVPVRVTGGLTFKQVEAKVYAACGVTTTDTLYCWGSNLNDGLALGTITGPEQCAWDETVNMPCVLLPVTIPGVPALVSLSASDGYTCGLTPTGAAYCWGHPQGQGDLLSNTAPVAVPGGLTFAMLSAGPSQTCGVTAAGVAYCWGFNGYGELGDGTTIPSFVPVKVAGQP